MSKIEVELIYRRNKSTGKIHKLVRMPSGQVMQGEQCNLDQAHNIVDEDELRESASDERCGHCFKGE